MVLRVSSVREGVADEVERNGDKAQDDGGVEQLVAQTGLHHHLAAVVDQVAQRGRFHRKAQADIGDEHLAADGGGVLLLFLTAICVTNPKHNKQRAQRSIPYISAIAAILTCILFYGQKDTYYTYREWKTLQELYHNQEYEQAASRYAGLFVQLYHRTDFLYEGAECFYKTGQHDIAIKWLDRALKLSAAPELYYAIAKNEKAIKQYQKAESYLLEISRILPEQGYTYFLLAKLYTNPSFLHPDKFHKAAKRFLAFQPSTQNNITKEMKEEILQIIRNWNFGK